MGIGWISLLGSRVELSVGVAGNVDWSEFLTYTVTEGENKIKMHEEMSTWLLKPVQSSSK